MAAASLGAGTVDLELWAGVRANQSPVVQAATLQNVMVPVWPIHQTRHTAQLALGMQVAVDQSAPNGVHGYLCSVVRTRHGAVQPEPGRCVGPMWLTMYSWIQSSIGAVNHARQNNMSLSTRYSHLERLQPDEFPPSGQGGVLSLVASTADDLAHVYVARYSRPKSRNAVSVRVKR
jgi:hypothetical protein